MLVQSSGIRDTREHVCPLGGWCGVQLWYDCWATQRSDAILTIRDCIVTTRRVSFGSDLGAIFSAFFVLSSDCVSDLATATLAKSLNLVESWLLCRDTRPLGCSSHNIHQGASPQLRRSPLAIKGSAKTTPVETAQLEPNWQWCCFCQPSAKMKRGSRHVARLGQSLQSRSAGLCFSEDLVHATLGR